MIKLLTPAGGSGGSSTANNQSGSAGSFQDLYVAGSITGSGDATFGRYINVPNGYVWVSSGQGVYFDAGGAKRLYYDGTYGLATNTSLNIGGGGASDLRLNINGALYMDGSTGTRYLFYDGDKVKLAGNTSYLNDLQVSGSITGSSNLRVAGSVQSAAGSYQPDGTEGIFAGPVRGSEFRIGGILLGINNTGMTAYGGSYLCDLYQSQSGLGVSALTVKSGSSSQPIVVRLGSTAAQPDGQAQVLRVGHNNASGFDGDQTTGTSTGSFVVYGDTGIGLSYGSSSGSAGNASISKATGQSAIASGSTSVTITNSLCKGPETIVIVTPLQVDTLTRSWGVAANGTGFTVTIDRGPQTNPWKFNWQVFNQIKNQGTTIT